ncbi:MAG: hypothetical protein LBU32_18290 [Clostridiales bacterium]|jgi:hypothetical protein|nr:hypothetical protein [Clostridiales bacterium]
MSKINDLYELSQNNASLRSDLDALNKKYSNNRNYDHESMYSELISVADKYGTTLSRADFDEHLGQYANSSVNSVSGGQYGSSSSNQSSNAQDPWRQLWVGFDNPYQSQDSTHPFK